MELFSSNIKKFLIFPQKKPFVVFRQMETPKKIVMFQEMETLKSFLYFMK